MNVEDASKIAKETRDQDTETNKYPTGAETQEPERLINTTGDRKIKEELLSLTAREYVEKHRTEMTPEELKEWEAKAKEEDDQERLDAENLQELEEENKKENQKEQNDIDEYDLSPEEVYKETEERIKNILEKDKRGELLSKEEKQMLVLFGEVERAEKEIEKHFQKKREEQEELQNLDLQLKKNVIAEYENVKKTNPKAINRGELGPKQEGVVVGRSLLRGLMFIAGTHWSIKKGYALLIKVWKEKGVELVFVNKLPKFVEFWSTNERGEDQISICKV